MSEYYETEPQDNSDQPWFLNQVVELEVDPEIWSPEGLLSAFQAIEAQMGRARTVPKGPRPIDIDMLLWEGLEQKTGYLDIPHPAMHQRAFVLVPLKEIAPDVNIGGSTRPDQALDSLEYTLKGRKIWQQQPE